PWEWSVSGAPARMSVQDGALNWTPSRAEVGSAPVSLTVKGAAGSASQDFTVDVTCDAPPEMKVGCSCDSSGSTALVFCAAAGLWLMRSRRSRRQTQR
ncbi:MAG: hypothetical protein ACJ790_15980, partial [Myxococcaceae bacterium]